MSERIDIFRVIEAVRVGLLGGKNGLTLTDVIKIDCGIFIKVLNRVLIMNVKVAVNVTKIESMKDTFRGRIIGSENLMINEGITRKRVKTIEA